MCITLIEKNMIEILIQSKRMHTKLKLKSSLKAVIWNEMEYRIF